MVNTIDMQDMMNLNLFNQITKVRTRFCFKYNEAIYFCVPKPLVSRAIGEGGRNIRKISEMIRKRVRVVAVPNGIADARTFIQAVVSPVTFKDVEIRDNELIINAGTQSKAALIGRNKRRFLEMQRVVKDFFGKELRIA